MNRTGRAFRPPESCTLTVGVLLAAGVDRQEVLRTLGEVLAPVEAVSPPIPFEGATYYEGEMGPGILRFHAALGGLWDPEALAEVKGRTGALEARWARHGRRRVNLDPGWVNASQLVLATGKPAGYRVYVGRGVYAEVEYVFSHGSFRPLPWTYPDYREPAALAFFNGIRTAHKRRTRRQR
ncbi:MAG: DUF4416 family protein [Deferrisomatales bacterium]